MTPIEEILYTAAGLFILMVIALAITFAIMLVEGDQGDDVGWADED